MNDAKTIQSRNMVAKHAARFNKCSVQRDRTKYYKKDKHKQTYH